MFPKMGKTFPNDGERPKDRLDYRSAISAALSRELGGSHRAVKTLMSWTDASDRTVKNWLSGTHGPSGENLVEILKHSDQAMFALAELTGREELKIVTDLNQLQSVLARLMASVTNALD